MLQTEAGCHEWQTWGYLMGVTMQVETGRRLCQAQGRLARGSGYSEASSSFGVCGP